MYDFVLKHSAIAVIPGYRLQPETTGLGIFKEHKVIELDLIIWIRAGRVFSRRSWITNRHNGITGVARAK